jgi:hypothetical protein
MDSLLNPFAHILGKWERTGKGWRDSKAQFQDSIRRELLHPVMERTG